MLDRSESASVGSLGFGKNALVQGMGRNLQLENVMLSSTRLRKGLRYVVCLGALAAWAGVAKADPLTVTVNLTDDQSNYSYSDGGEFMATFTSGFVNHQAANVQQVVGSSALNAIVNQTNQVFCVETAVDFTPVNWGGPTYYAAISPNIIGQVAPLAPIGLNEAEYLYYQFATGTLLGYDYTQGAGRTTSAGTLQDAIWTLLGETLPGSFSLAQVDPTRLASWILSAQTNGQGANSNVSVLNLYAGSTTTSAVIQNQLILTGTSGAADMPVPTSFLGTLPLLGLVAVGGVRRRRNKNRFTPVGL